MEIIENIERITSQIKAINDRVELVAATKTHDIDEIRCALNTGKVSCAGENKVQELVGKYAPDVTWDFIGRLQTNKVKYIIDKVRLIHSVDRFSLAQVIDKEAAKINKVQDVLIEINSGKEESKGGIFIEDLPKFTDSLLMFEHIKVRGIMAVAPIDLNDDDRHRLFDGVYKAYLRYAGEDFKYLSMGMSNDYLIAVESGANMVRIGRGIFGERNYTNNNV